MMWHRIWAMILRYFYVSRDPSRIVEFVFWPAIDIGFIGLIGMWVGGHHSQMVSMIVSALVLWQIIYRAHYEVAVNLMDEFWEQNITNIVSTPLKKSEWVAAMMISGLGKTIFTLGFGAFIAWLFFSVNIFQLGWWLLPMFLLCILSGWMVGFISAGIIIYKGHKLSQLPWVVIILAGLFSAIYYPLSILPGWMQTTGEFIPMTYVFESIRELITTGNISSHYLVFSLFLNLAYLVITISFFLTMFRLSKKKGLARLLF